MVAPIICEGDAIGAVLIMSREPRAKFGDMEMKLATTAGGVFRPPDGELTMWEPRAGYRRLPVPGRPPQARP